MDPREQEISELRQQLEELRRRVERLESAGAPARPQAPAASVERKVVSPPPIETQSRPIAPPPVFPNAYDTPTASESLEKRIGTHWLNRVGIVAVLVGVSYFVKYAFDNGWIGPAGRIAIGLLAGIAITVWSEHFRRKSYVLFSYGLKAVGIGTLYLSLWAAVQLYHLIPAGAGFVAMVIVTAATVAMALSENAQLLAAYALAGGFSTPALCSTGENHEIFLFSYTTLLAAGAIALTALRSWRRLALGAFIGTLLMYVAWYSTYYDSGERITTIFFATLFFLIFAAAPLVPRTGEPQDSTTLTAVVAVANALVYFLQLYAIFDSGFSHQTRDDIMAWISVALAAFYVALAQRVGKQSGGAENRKAINLIHLAVAVGFLTTAIPLKLSGHWITIGWLMESAALLHVAHRIGHTFLKTLASVALILGLVHLLIESWPRETVLFLNPRFSTYLVAIAVMGMVVYGTRRSEDGPEKVAAAISIVLVSLLALIALHWEIQDFFQPEIAARWSERAYAAARTAETVRGFTHSAVWMIYGAMLMYLGFQRGSSFLRWQAIALLGATIVKVFIFDTSNLDMGFRILSFIGLGVVLLGVSFLYQRKILVLPKREL